MSQQKLKETIDRMVEDSIRRILPNVINEVLVKVIANANVMTETPPARAPLSARPTRPVMQPKARPTKKGDLRSMLESIQDPEAGADFYSQYGGRPEPEQHFDPDSDDEEVPVMRRLAQLPPELQSLAEGLDVDGDFGAGDMWDGPTSMVNPPGDDAGPLEMATKRTGVDFSRMKDTLKGLDRKSPVVKRDQRDVQFEEERLARKREQLSRQA